MDVESVIAEIQKLSSDEKRRVEEALHAAKANDLRPALSQAQWHGRVDEFYGIMRDDPISRGEQSAPQKRPPLK